MRLELAVIRLQVQLDRLKPGLPPHRRYEPGVLRQVTALKLTPRGVIGVAADGAEHIDVHHMDHPHSRNSKGRNGISIMATGDYVALRERYGPHLLDGIAGESVLLECAEGLAGRDMPEQVAVVMGETPGAERTLALTGVHVAKPCVEFTRFCLRQDGAVDDAVKQGLRDLDDGARGYKMTTAGIGTISIGDRLVIELGG